MTADLDIIQTFRRSPTGFATEALGIEKVHKHQSEILSSVRDNRRTLVISSNSIGKDFIAAAAVLWWLAIWDECLAITTAITGSQVREVQWSEIRTRYRRATYDIGGYVGDVEPFLRVDDRRNAFGISTRDEPERLHGLHRAHILIVITEGSAVPQSVFDGLRTLGASQDLRVLVLANPTRNSGEVFEACHAQREGYNVLTYSGFDLPNLKACVELGPEHMADQRVIDDPTLCPNPYPYLINHTYERESARDFGDGSDWYKVHVLGQFGDSETNALIPLAWIEEAFARKGVVTDKRFGGLDIARLGADRTAYCEHAGNVFYRIEEWPKQDLEDTWDRLTGETLLGADKKPKLILIDDTGLGGGMVPRAERDRRYSQYVGGVSFSEAAENKLKFANRPSEMWWTLRQRLDPTDEDPLAFACGIETRRRLTKQLSIVTYDTDNRGRIRVDKKGGGDVSPDLGDALILSLEAERVGSRWTVR